MFTVLILICAVATPRDDCALANAERWMPVAEAADLISCMMAGRVAGASLIAQGHLTIADDEYPKIICIDGPQPREA